MCMTPWRKRSSERMTVEGQRSTSVETKPWIWSTAWAPRIEDVDRQRMPRSMIWERMRGAWRRARFGRRHRPGGRSSARSSQALDSGFLFFGCDGAFGTAQDAATSIVVDTQMTAARRAAGKNILVVSHCDFTGNSAFHVYAIATELDRMGWSPAIAVPRNPGGVRELGRPTFPVLSYRDVERGRLRFQTVPGPISSTPLRLERRAQLALGDVYPLRVQVRRDLEDNELPTTSGRGRL